MSPTRTLVFLAALVCAPALAAAPAAPIDRDSVAQGVSADLRADPIRFEAAQAFVAVPDLAERAANPVARSTRTGAVRFMDAPEDPRVAAVHLDHALRGKTALRPAHARAAAEIVEDPGLLETALADADAPVVAAALSGLHRRAEPVWAKVLADHAKDGDIRVQEVAISLLSRRADAGEHLDTLRQATASSSPTIRLTAARALGVFGESSDIPRLQRLIQDTDAKVGAVATLALERLQSR